MSLQFLDYTNIKPAEYDVKNKVVLLTGAADGIGRAVTLALAEQGATVLMLDKKARHLEKLYDQIVSANYTEPVIIPYDLDQLTAEAATTIAQGVADDFGKLDDIVHYAAELGSSSPMDQYDLELWNTVMQVNLHAPYLLTRALLPLLKQDYQTNLLFSSADVGRIPQAYWGAYSIAYAGLEAQMRIWAEELEKTSNIKVNSVDPGAVRTGFRRRSHPGESQEALTPPQALTSAYLHLLSETHGFHGQQLALQKPVK